MVEGDVIMSEITNEERLKILAAARSLGFNQGPAGTLICTIDQLVNFASNVATATAEQIIAAFSEIKK